MVALRLPAPVMAPGNATMPSGTATATTRTLLFAGAMLGATELILHRIASPVLSHIPSSTIDSAVAETVDMAGERAFHGAALLLVLAAVGVVVVSARGAVAVSVLVGMGVVAAGAAAVADDAGARLGVQLVFAGGAAGVAGLALADGVSWRTGAVCAGAVSLVAGRLPLVHDAARDLAGSGGAFPTGASMSVAEATFVAVPVVLAAGLVARGGVSRGGWIAAAAGAVLALAAMAGSPYTAMISTWATGVTMSLPAMVYVVAAGAGALALATWLRRPEQRLLAAGLVLLAVGGTQPAVVHHNLTAILGLVLLAGVMPAREWAARTTNGAGALD